MTVTILRNYVLLNIAAKNDALRWTWLAKVYPLKPFELKPVRIYILTKLLLLLYINIIDLHPAFPMRLVSFS